ncbi:MAG TPA: preprotein translocase subunit SecG [Gammaproteobacteria bacterium]|jgi:preprotein translocase subunit SecG|nr:preprotein translocase subunit SecG [Gammaproteobacteria bacterium]
MFQFIMLIHVLSAVCIIALVLVQQGKGATMGAAFGSGASQTVFGSRGSGSFLFRLTMGFAAAFFITSIALNNIAMRAYKAERVITLPVAPTATQPLPDKALTDSIPSTPNVPGKQ